MVELKNHKNEKHYIRQFYAHNSHNDKWYTGSRICFLDKDNIKQVIKTTTVPLELIFKTSYLDLEIPSSYKYAEFFLVGGGGNSQVAHRGREDLDNSVIAVACGGAGGGNIFSNLELIELNNNKLSIIVGSGSSKSAVLYNKDKIIYANPGDNTILLYNDPAFRLHGYPLYICSTYAYNIDQASPFIGEVLSGGGISSGGGASYFDKVGVSPFISRINKDRKRFSNISMGGKNTQKGNYGITTQGSDSVIGNTHVKNGYNDNKSCYMFYDEQKYGGLGDGGQGAVLFKNPRSQYLDYGDFITLFPHYENTNNNGGLGQIAYQGIVGYDAGLEREGSNGKENTGSGSGGCSFTPITNKSAGNYGKMLCGGSGIVGIRLYSTPFRLNVPFNTYIINNFDHFEKNNKEEAPNNIYDYALLNGDTVKYIATIKSNSNNIQEKVDQLSKRFNGSEAVSINCSSINHAPVSDWTFYDNDTQQFYYLNYRESYRLHCGTKIKDRSYEN